MRLKAMYNFTRNMYLDHGIFYIMYLDGDLGSISFDSTDRLVEPLKV